mgnify:CR=1 FL=1
MSSISGFQPQIPLIPGGLQVENHWGHADHRDHRGYLGGLEGAAVPAQNRG